jgi:hypothetical protein
MSVRALVGGGMRPRARYRAHALGGLLLALLMTGAPYVPTAASGEVTRTVKDNLWAVHNVVLINYDPVNKRYRAHCVSVGNSRVKKQILACRLTDSKGEVKLGKGVGPSYEGVRTHSDLLGRKPNTCVVSAMGLKLIYRESTYKTTLKTECVS